MSENNQARGTDAQILKERELTASAIRGAMAFGYQGTNPPPQDPKDHWLSEFWEIGREQRRLELAAQAAPAGVQAEPITDSQAVKSLHAVIRSAGGLVHSDGNIFFTNVDVFQLAALAWQASEATSPPAAQEQADTVQGQLLPLPEPACYLLNGTHKLAEASETSYAVLIRTADGHGERLPMFTADQMREYARSHLRTAPAVQASAQPDDYEQEMADRAGIAVAQPAPVAAQPVAKTMDDPRNGDTVRLRLLRPVPAGTLLYTSPQPQGAGVVEARDAKRWNAMLELPGARRRIWNHVLDEEAKAGHESIESAIDALRASSAPDQSTAADRGQG